MRHAFIAAALVLVACAFEKPHSNLQPTPKPQASATMPKDVPAARDDGRLPPGVTPTRYSLELTINPAESTFFGRVRIGVVIEKPTHSIVLHAKGPKVMTAAISSAAKKHWAHAETRMAAHGKKE